MDTHTTFIIKDIETNIWKEKQLYFAALSLMNEEKIEYHHNRLKFFYTKLKEWKQYEREEEWLKKEEKQ